MAKKSVFSDSQRSKLRDLLEKEPCLFNARHKRDYVTMSAWLNEVGGDQIATPEAVAEVMAPDGADRWDVHAGKWVADVAAPAASSEAAVDSWKAQRKALGDALR